MNVVSASNQTLSTLSSASDRIPRVRTFCNLPSSPSFIPPNPTHSRTRKSPGKGLDRATGKGLDRARWHRRAPHNPNLPVKHHSDRSQSCRWRVEAQHPSPHTLKRPKLFCVGIPGGGLRPQGEVRVHAPQGSRLAGGYKFSDKILYSTVSHYATALNHGEETKELGKVPIQNRILEEI
ncbi:hypothetical protein B9Z19DRAFT_1091102 [Tuber borchii]|uniref:Uncharacterized protein n=1 Tax=Tuber borchii TaxID=42251 RepID=A0A2T6ZI07_TUBBO|nr:hypothetical protein B9Z19DRAFT_1091102 [Tuber borchii]